MQISDADGSLDMKPAGEGVLTHDMLISDDIFVVRQQSQYTD